ncbi:MAG: hypothetical protein JWQ79_3351 [Mucilaginibacter sp.]|nr:hypothetical protein [Mucilaginibacter sp.]
MKKSIATIMLAFIVSAAFSQAKQPVTDSVKISRQDYELFKSLIGPTLRKNTGAIKGIHWLTIPTAY